MISDEWHIRQARPTDLEAILALERTCAEAPHWSRALWMAALGEQQAEGPVRAGFVAEDAAEMLGFAVASRGGALAELESVVVSELARRRGIGRALCRQVMDWSRNVGASELELEVRASSGGALALYRLLGFTEQGSRREYYRNPTEDAVLMSIRL